MGVMFHPPITDIVTPLATHSHELLGLWLGPHIVSTYFHPVVTFLLYTLPSHFAGHTVDVWIMNTSLCMCVNLSSVGFYGFN